MSLRAVLLLVLLAPALMLPGGGRLSLCICMGWSQAFAEMDCCAQAPPREATPQQPALEPAQDCADCRELALPERLASALLTQAAVALPSLAPVDPNFLSWAAPAPRAGALAVVRATASGPPRAAAPLPLRI